MTNKHKKLKSNEERQTEFVKMIKEHERLILRVCALYNNGQCGELRDLYQDAVCALWESYPSFKGNSKISTWIFSVTRYTMFAHLRKNRLTITTMDDNERQLPDVGQETENDALDELRNALAYLQPEDKDLIVMWLEGFELEEIAKIIGMKYAAVATRLFRIKRKLKKIINP